MKRYLITAATLLTLGAAFATSATAAPDISRQLAQGQGMGPSGSMGQGTPMGFMNMLTERERSEFQERMKNAGSEAERERIRAEFSEKVQQRTHDRSRMMDDERRRMRDDSGRGRGGGGGRGR